MATCVSNESLPLFNPSLASFTLKPRVEKDDRKSGVAAPLFAPSFGRGLRIRSSFDDDDRSAGSAKEQPENVAAVTVEPPEWAVKAAGEARLEPVGPTASTHDSVDLSSKACFKVGRSPSSDMRLQEPTSSRKHALLFHHPNGSCYVVDCGSAHGTYVNGVRVERPTPKQGGRATATPHKVRKGALIRFGGPGAPTFVLRSFSATLEGLVRDLSVHTSPCIRGGSCSPSVTDKPSKGELPSFLPTLAPTTPRPKMPCSPGSALVVLNTRVNALGGGALLSHRNRLIATRAVSKFDLGSLEKDQIDSCLLGKRFRSEDFHYTSEEECYTASPSRLIKRIRSASFPVSPEPSSGGCLKLCRLDTMTTPLVSQESLNTLEEDILRTFEGRRRVKFQEDREFVYPPSVTPDLHGSFDEEHMASLKM